MHSGLISKWYKDSLPENPCVGLATESPTAVTILDFSYVLTFVLGAGLGVSALAFFAEILLHQFKCKRTYQAFWS